MEVYFHIFFYVCFVFTLTSISKILWKMNDCIINYGILVFRSTEVISLTCMMLEYSLKKWIAFPWNIKTMHNFSNTSSVKILTNRLSPIPVMHYMHLSDTADHPTRRSNGWHHSPGGIRRGRNQVSGGWWGRLCPGGILGQHHLHHGQVHLQTNHQTSTQKVSHLLIHVLTYRY